MKHLIDIEKALPYCCEDCKYYIENLRCAAFQVIPLSIYYNPESHNKVIAGQCDNYIFSTDKPRNTMRVYMEDDI